MSQWYYAKNGQQLGPVTGEAIKAGVAKGQLTASDLVWQDGMADWRKIKEIPELSSNGAAPVQPQAQRPVQAQPQPQQQQQPAVQVAPTYQPQYQQPIAYQQPHHGSVVLTERALDMLRQTGPWVRLFGVLLWIGVGLGAIGVLIFLIGALMSIGSGKSAGIGGGVVMLVMAMVWGAMLLLYFMPGLYLNRYASRIGDLMRTRREDVAEAALEAQKSFWKFLGIVTLISIVLYLLMIVIVVIGGVAAAGAASSGSRGGGW